MSDFEIGSGAAAKYREAKSLPTGTKVRIVSIEPKESPMLTDKLKAEAEKKGLEYNGEKAYQGLVIFEALEDGETMAYEAGRANNRRTVAGEPFAAGDRFRHYFNGIYSMPNGKWRVSQQQNFASFLNAIAEIGGPKPGKFDRYAGLTLTLERVRGMGANGTYWTPMPKELVAAPAAPAPAAEVEEDAEPEPAPAPKKVVPKKGKGAASAATPSAFDALSAEDKDCVLEYVKESGGTAFAEAKDLVGVVARDLAHAQAILAAIPKGA